jgi:DNA polymerase (family 10)
MSLNQELSTVFSTMAAILEIKGEPVFKAIAFGKVSRILGDMTLDIATVCKDGELDEIEGIGPSSRRIIEEYCKTGRSTDYDELSASVPAGLIPLLSISGLGPKTIALLWKQRQITSLAELIDAMDQGKLEGLKGIGEKKIEQIRQGIALHAQASGRVPIIEALPLAQTIVERLRKLPGIANIEIAGSLRRGSATVGDIDIVCAARDEDSARIIAADFVKIPEAQRVLAHGQTKASILTSAGVQVDLRIVAPENFGAALLYFTGSKHHNVKLRGRAQDMEMTLNEWGLYRLAAYEKAAKKPGAAPAIKAVAGETEASVYSALGLAMIEPELREDRGEIEAAAAGTLPKLISPGDIKGDLHCHTTASDGTASILEMARAAQALGYKFLALTDHSKSQVIANGLSAERLLKHAADIRAAGRQLKGITLLAGCEVDILVDGRLDFDDDVLRELDIVVASPHVSLRQDTAKSTDRLLRAIENRYVNVIGHPTGRLINQRAGLPLDFPRIFAAAAKTGTALEINASWPRLDLDETQARAAAAAGAMLAIDTDAHSTAGLGGMPLGIQVARRAWLGPANVINCLPPARLLEFIARKRK